MGSATRSGDQRASGRAGDRLQREARALGDPTRHRIFRHISDAWCPVDVAELTALVRLNHNAVRQHLTVLKDAELVVEEIEQRSRPRRPRLLYRLNPDAVGFWGTEGPYELLASLLSEVVRTHASPREVGHDEGGHRVRQISRPPRAPSRYSRRTWWPRASIRSSSPTLGVVTSCSDAVRSSRSQQETPPLSASCISVWPRAPPRLSTRVRSST